MSSVESTPKEIAELLGDYSSFLIVSHLNPDADAYGSSLALTHALRAMGKKVVCLNQSGALSRYAFIPGVEQVQITPPVDDWDVLVICDCGDLKRIGDNLREKLSFDKPVINIDHHVSNDNFGNFNLVQVEASSTSEIIYDVLAHTSLKLTSEIATCLFAGLSGDTGSFRYGNTNEKNLRIASELVAAGAEPAKIGTALYASISLSAFRLRSLALSNIEMHYSDRVSLIKVDKDMYARFSASSQDTEGLVENARDIAGVEVAIFMYQDDGVWRTSLRSKGVDVSAIASSFGGGGHKLAAAFRSKNSFEEIKGSLLLKIKEALNS